LPNGATRRRPRLTRPTADYQRNRGGPAQHRLSRGARLGQHDASRRTFPVIETPADVGLAAIFRRTRRAPSTFQTLLASSQVFSHLRGRTNLRVGLDGGCSTSTPIWVSRLGDGCWGDDVAMPRPHHLANVALRVSRRDPPARRTCAGAAERGVVVGRRWLTAISPVRAPVHRHGSRRVADDVIYQSVAGSMCRAAGRGVRYVKRTARSTHGRPSTWAGASCGRRRAGYDPRLPLLGSRLRLLAAADGGGRARCPILRRPRYTPTAHWFTRAARGAAA